MVPVDSILPISAMLLSGEDTIIAFLVLVLFALLVTPVWALIRTFKLKRNSATRGDLAQLTGRIYDLETRIGKLQKTLEDILQGKDVVKEGPPAAAPLVKPAAPVPAPSEKPAVPPAAVPPPIPPPRPPMPLREEMLAAPASTAPPKFQAAPPAPKRGWADIEEKLGTNWLNKIGITALVIGTAFFLNYAMKQLGPAGKITVGYLIALALIALGVVAERRERYQLPARAVLGGGWALAYFVTYALHNIPLVRVVESPIVGFLLLFVVAAAMVGHSLRYNSQMVTGLAYLLAFSSVAVRFLQPTEEAGRIGVGSLVASVVLAASLVVVLARRKWYEMEPIAIIATYGVHWLWLIRVRDWYGPHKPFPDFNASVALCTLYWVIYTVSHYLRNESEKGKRDVLIASFLANAAGYLLVLRYQSIHPEWRFWFLLFAGAVYLSLAAYSRGIGRRLGFLLSSTIGATLMVVAIPYRYSDARLELIWLVEAQALLFVGWKLAEPHLRKLGWAGLGVVAVYVTFNDLSPRLAAWRSPDPALGWLLVVLAAAFYANSRLAPRLLGDQGTETDESAAKVSSPVASAFVLAAAWVALPFMWAGLLWTLTALALLEAGRRVDDPVLRACGHGAAVLAAGRLLVVNFHFAQPFFGTNLRALTVGLAIALFYLASRRVWPLPAGSFEEPGLRGYFARQGGTAAAYTWTASALATLLLWNEITNAAVALAWGLAALLLLEAGRALAEKPLVLQAHALFALSFVRIFIADLNAEGPLGPFTERLVSVTLVALLYYYAAATSPDEWPRMRAALYWFGTTALVALARFELPLDWVAVGWAAMTAALYFTGRKLSLPVLRYQAYLLTLGVALRCAFDNFYQKSILWAGLNVRTVTITLVSLVLYALLAEALLRRRPIVPVAEAGDD